MNKPPALASSRTSLADLAAMITQGVELPLGDPIGIADQLLEKGFSEAAVTLIHSLLRRDPWHPDALQRRALLAHARGDRAAALADVERIRTGPYAHEERQHTGLSEALVAIGEYAEGLASAETALQLNPHSLIAATRAARAYACLARYGEALLWYERATRMEPSAPADLMHRVAAQLMLGRLGRALQDNEARLYWFGRDPSSLPQNHRPYWSGAPLRGRTLLVWDEAGNGDVIQNARFFQCLRPFGGRIIFATRPTLIGIMRASRLADEVVSTAEPPPAFDEHIPLESIARIVGIEYETMPSPDGYLVAPQAESQASAHARSRRPHKRRRVGIVWAGNPEHSNDRQRSMPSDALTRLIALTPGIEWVSLQVGPRATEPKHHQALASIQDPDEPLRDYATTARVVTSLDLVVTVDTSVAHLTGALGHPVWTLLPTGPDPRWMLLREDTPWYRSMRLFRQSRPDDWMELVTRVAAELRGWVRSRTSMPEAKQLQLVEDVA